MEILCGDQAAAERSALGLAGASSPRKSLNAKLCFMNLDEQFHPLPQHQASKHKNAPEGTKLVFPST